jgi:hypothetical protein
MNIEKNITSSGTGPDGVVDGMDSTINCTSRRKKVDMSADGTIVAAGGGDCFVTLYSFGSNGICNEVERVAFTVVTFKDIAMSTDGFSSLVLLTEEETRVSGLVNDALI